MLTSSSSRLPFDNLSCAIVIVFCDLGDFRIFLQDWPLVFGVDTVGLQFFTDERMYFALCFLCEFCRGSQPLPYILNSLLRPRGWLYWYWDASVFQGHIQCYPSGFLSVFVGGYPGGHSVRFSCPEYRTARSSLHCLVHPLCRCGATLWVQVDMWAGSGVDERNKD
jgi:hypothetical protein